MASIKCLIIGEQVVVAFLTKRLPYSNSINRGFNKSQQLAKIVVYVKRIDLNLLLTFNKINDRVKIELPLAACFAVFAICLET